MSCSILLLNTLVVPVDRISVYRCEERYNRFVVFNVQGIVLTRVILVTIELVIWLYHREWIMYLVFACIVWCIDSFLMRQRRLVAATE